MKSLRPKHAQVVRKASVWEYPHWMHSPEAAVHPAYVAAQAAESEAEESEAIPDAMADALEAQASDTVTTEEPQEAPAPRLHRPRKRSRGKWPRYTIIQ